MRDKLRHLLRTPRTMESFWPWCNILLCVLVLSLVFRMRALEEDYRRMNNHTRYCVVEDFQQGDAPPVGYRHSYLHVENQWPPVILEGQKVVEADVFVFRTGGKKVAFVAKEFHPKHPETPAGFVARAVQQYNENPSTY